MKREYKYRLIFGPVILAAGIALQVFYTGIDELVSITLIVIGVVLIANGVYRYIRYGELPERDERTRKINAFATAYSWWTTMVFIAIIMWLNHFSIVNLNSTQILGLILFVMGATAVLFKWYLMRKGDIE